MLSQQTRSSGTIFSNAVSHSKRHLISAAFIAAIYSMVKNQWEVSSEHHVITGTHVAVDSGFFFMQLLLLCTIAGCAGNIVDQSRELKKGAGQAKATRPISERFKEAPVRTFFFSLAPKTMMTMVGFSQQFFTPLLLSLMFSAKDDLGIAPQGQTEWKVFKSAVMMAAGAYGGYLLASIALNINFIHAQVVQEVQNELFLPDALSDDSMEEAPAAGVCDRVKTMAQAYTYTILLPLGVSLLSLISNLWMMTTNRSAIAGHRSTNEVVFIVYTALSAVAAAVFGFAADRTNHIIDKGNVNVQHAPLVNSSVMRKKLPVFMLLWLLCGALEAETLGKWNAGVLVPDIHNDDDSAQVCWKAFLDIVMVATVLTAAAAQNTLHSGLAAIKKSPVSTQGTRGTLFSVTELEYEDNFSNDPSLQSVSLTYSKVSES